MTNRLTEQQLQEELLDEIGDFTKAITRKIGQGVGGIKGAGQKVKGAVTRAGQGLKQAYTQGRDSAQKTVAGQDYKASQPKAKAQAQAQTQAQAQGQTKTKQTGVLGNLAKNLGNVALDTAAGSGYNYRQGVNPNPTKTTGPAAGLQKADAEAQRKAGLEKKLGTTGAQATATNTAKTAVDKSIARNQKKKDKQSAMKQGIDQAQIDGANQGIANMQKQAGQTATKVPGQKAPVTQVDKNKDGKDDKSGKPMAPAPTGKGPSSGAGGAAAQVDANKDGKDDKTGKPISKTAQNVGKNAGVNTARIGKDKLDLNDPKLQNLRKAIEKASAGTVDKIDKLDPAGKQKLKKAIS